MPSTATPISADERQAIGARIRELRLIHELTQTTFAERCYVSQPAVSAWERGTKLPSVAAQRRIADVLHASRAVLFREIVRAEERRAA